MRGIGVLLALVGLKLCARGSTDSEMDIPRSNTAGLTAHIPFHEDGARNGAFGLEDEVADFDSTLIAGLANLEDRRGLVLVRERGTRGHDQGPDFTGDLDVLGYFYRRGDNISTVIEINNLIWLGFVKNRLDGCGIVGFAVAFCTRGLH